MLFFSNAVFVFEIPATTKHDKFQLVSDTSDILDFCWKWPFNCALQKISVSFQVWKKFEYKLDLFAKIDIDILNQVLLYQLNAHAFNTLPFLFLQRGPETRLSNSVWSLRP